MAHINRFIINSDYLSMARAGNYSANVIIGTGELTYIGDIVRLTNEVKIPAPNGAICQMNITYTPPNGEPTSAMGIMTIITGDLQDTQGRRLRCNWNIYTRRKDRNTLIVDTIVMKTGAPDGTKQIFPSLPIKINVSYFYPPNIK